MKARPKTRNVALGNVIAAARVAANLTREQLAKKMGRSMSSICEWELGDHGPRLDEVAKLARILRVSPVEIVKAAAA